MEELQSPTSKPQISDPFAVNNAWGIAERSRIKHNPMIRAIVKKFWDVARIRKEPTLSRDEYLQLNVAISKALLPKWEEQSAKLSAESEWAVDTPTTTAQKEMSFQEFKDFIFDIADRWCTTISVSDYISFLESLFSGITAPKTQQQQQQQEQQSEIEQQPQQEGNEQQPTPQARQIRQQKQEVGIVMKEELSKLNEISFCMEKAWKLIIEEEETRDREESEDEDEESESGANEFDDAATTETENEVTTPTPKEKQPLEASIMNDSTSPRGGTRPSALGIRRSLRDLQKGQQKQQSKHRKPKHSQIGGGEETNGYDSEEELNADWETAPQNIVILGHPGSGVEILGKRLARALEVNYLEPNNLIESAVSSTTTTEEEGGGGGGSEDVFGIGQAIVEHLKAGNSIDGQSISNMIDIVVHNPLVLGQGFVISGFPKDVNQLEDMKTWYSSPSAVIVIDLPSDDSKKALETLRWDPATGKTLREKPKWYTKLLSSELKQGSDKTWHIPITKKKKKKKEGDEEDEDEDDVDEGNGDEHSKKRVEKQQQQQPTTPSTGTHPNLNESSSSSSPKQQQENNEDSNALTEEENGYLDSSSMTTTNRLLLPPEAIPSSAKELVSRYENTIPIIERSLSEIVGEKNVLHVNGLQPISDMLSHVLHWMGQPIPIIPPQDLPEPPATTATSDNERMKYLFEFGTTEETGPRSLSYEWGSFCPVTFVEQRVLVHGMDQFAVSYMGKVFLFVDEQKRNAFKADPKKYLREPPPGIPSHSRVCVIGPPFSGTSTQAKLLSQWMGVYLIDPKVLVSAAFAAGTNNSEACHFPNTICEDVKKALLSGEQISAKLLCDLIEAEIKFHKKIGEEGYSNNKYGNGTGFVIDDFPRTAEQARMLGERGICPELTIIIRDDEAGTEIKASSLPQTPESVLLHDRYSKYTARNSELKDALRNAGSLIAAEVTVSASSPHDVHGLVIQGIMPYYPTPTDCSNEEPDVNSSNTTAAALPPSFNRIYGDTGRFCPVTFKEHGWLVPGISGFGLRYKGKIYCFANEAAMDKFFANPNEYVWKNGPPELPPPHIFITGPDGAGRTSVATKLARETGLTYVSVDVISEKILKMVTTPKTNKRTHKHKKTNGEGTSNTESNTATEDEAMTITAGEEGGGEEEEEQEEEEDRTLQGVIDKLKVLGDNNGYIVDGFPRNENDLKGLITVGHCPDTIILLTCDAETTVERKFKTPSAETIAKMAEAIPAATTSNIAEPQQLTADQEQQQQQQQQQSQQQTEEQQKQILEAATKAAADEAKEILRKTNATQIALLETVQAEAKSRKISISVIQSSAPAATHESVWKVVSESLLPALRDRSGLFSSCNCVQVSSSSARALLRIGSKKLSKFGHSCPVHAQTLGNSNLALLSPTSSSNPCVYRHRIYFPCSSECVSAFVHNPDLYARMNWNIGSDSIPRCCILGAHLSGRSAIAKKIESATGASHVTLSKAIREAIYSQSALGQRIEEVLHSGLEIPPEMCREAVKSILTKASCRCKGFVLSGFPRTEEDFISLYESANEQKTVIAIEQIFLIDSDAKDLLTRARNKIKNQQPQNGGIRLETIGMYKERMDMFNESAEALSQAINNTCSALHRIEGTNDRSFWSMSEEVLHSVCHSGMQRHKYNRAIAHLKPASCNGLCIKHSDVESNLSHCGLYCPVSLAKGELRACNNPRNYNTASLFDGKFYFMGDENKLEEFVMRGESLPTSFAESLKQLQLPAHLPRRLPIAESRQIKPDQFEMHGFCPVSYSLGQGFIKCSNNLETCVVIKFRSAIYAIANEHNAELFMRTPDRYLRSLPAKLPPEPEPIQINKLPLTGYLEQAVGAQLALALEALAIQRPMCPQLSPAKSAQRFIGLYLKTHGTKCLGPFAKQVYTERLEKLCSVSDALLKLLAIATGNSTSTSEDKKAAQIVDSYIASSFDLIDI